MDDRRPVQVSRSHYEGYESWTKTGSQSRCSSCASGIGGYDLGSCDITAICVAAIRRQSMRVYAEKRQARFLLSAWLQEGTLNKSG